MLKIPATLAAAALALTACGGSTPSPEAQVRTTETKIYEALTSSHPERACVYSVDHDGCIQGVVTAKAMGLDFKALANVPDDWHARIAKAKVIVTGSTATLAPDPSGKTSTLVLRSGHWLDNTK